VTLAVASATLGKAPPVMVAEPDAKPVTRTVALVAFAAKLTVGGTDATPGLLELKGIVRAVGVGADRFSVRYCAPLEFITTLPG